MKWCANNVPADQRSRVGMRVWMTYVQRRLQAEVKTLSYPSQPEVSHGSGKRPKMPPPTKEINPTTEPANIPVPGTSSTPPTRTSKTEGPLPDTEVESVISLESSRLEEVKGQVEQVEQTMWDLQGRMTTMENTLQEVLHFVKTLAHHPTPESQ